MNLPRARPLRASEKAALWAAGGLLGSVVYRRHKRPIELAAERATAVVAPVDRSWLGMAKETIAKFSADNAQTHGAALSYYTMFSIAPLLLICMTLVGLFMGTGQAQTFINGRLGQIMGPNTAKMVSSMAQSTQTSSGKGLAGIVGVVVLLFGAAGVVQQLQTSLDVMWGAPASATSGIMATIKSKIVSVAFVLAIGFLLLVSLVLSAAVAAFGKWAGGFLPLPAPLLQAINVVVSYGVISLMFALMFKLLPHARPTWGDVWIGALVTGLLFELGNWLLGLYFGKAAPTSSYGAAGSLLAVMLWAYYCAQILYLGAEFTRTYAQRRGSGLPALQET